MTAPIKGYRHAVEGSLAVIQCPIEDCEYQTPDLDPGVAAALITTHTTVHASPHSVMPVAKAEKVKHPCISSAGSGTSGLDEVTM